jgi:allene oxide cyclase
MHSSSKAIALVAGSVLAVGSLFGVAAAAGASKSKGKKPRGNGNTVHVIEHAVTDTEVPSGGGKDVTGNVLTFHNNVYNKADKKQVGTDLGFCVRISPADGSWTCEWTTFLAKGQINVAGPFYDTKNSVLAITGGTGAYRKARGEMNLNSLMGGKEYDFIFHLS